MKNDMASSRRTRSRGLVASETQSDTGFWNSLPDPRQMEREQVEAVRLARMATRDIRAPTGDTQTKQHGQNKASKLNNPQLAIENGKIPPIQQQVMPPVVNAQDWGEILPNNDELGDRLGTSNETGEISPNHPHEVSSDKDNYFTVPF